jgi:hypothetical protein
MSHKAIFASGILAGLAAHTQGAGVNETNDLSHRGRPSRVRRASV